MTVPPNFSWISEGLLCAMAFPGEKAHLSYLQENGVTHLVSLTAESSPPVEQVPGCRIVEILKDVTESLFVVNRKQSLPELSFMPPFLKSELAWHQLKIHDFTPPTMEQVVSFINIVNNARKNKTAVGIHCAAGRGRTGTMVCCFMVNDMHITAKDAIELIRELRPGSVETEDQEKLVAEYQQKLTKEENWKAKPRPSRKK